MSKHKIILSCLLVSLLLAFLASPVLMARTYKASPAGPPHWRAERTSEQPNSPLGPTETTQLTEQKEGPLGRIFNLLSGTLKAAANAVNTLLGRADTTAPSAIEPDVTTEEPAQYKYVPTPGSHGRWTRKQIK